MSTGQFIGSGSVAPPSPATAQFTGYGTPGGFTGTLVPAELREETPFPYPALEMIRRKVLTAVTSGTALPMKVRTITILTLGTSLHGIFDAIFTITDSELAVRRTDRLRTIAIDAALNIDPTLLTQAFSEFRQIGVPQQYIDVLNTWVTSTSYTNRVAGFCGMVLLTAIILTGVS